MRAAIEETERRRSIQEAFNKENDITPTTISKPIKSPLNSVFGSSQENIPEKVSIDVSIADIPKEITKLRKEMRKAAESLAFEQAAELRDRIKYLEVYALKLG